MIKESDITAFLLTHKRIVIPHSIGTNWTYFNDDYEYDVVNTWPVHSYIEIMEQNSANHHWGRRDIHTKHGSYTEREALKIIVSHWNKNEKNLT